LASAVSFNADPPHDPCLLACSTTSAHPLYHSHASPSLIDHAALTPLAEAACEDQLSEGYFPEQIAGCLRRAYPGDMWKQLSVEIIYVGLTVLPRGINE
jgi:hypothetical protein